MRVDHDIAKIFVLFIFERNSSFGRRKRVNVVLLEELVGIRFARAFRLKFVRSNGDIVTKVREV